MCGFAGFLDRSGHVASDVLVDVVGRMNEAVRHRGPDAGGTWMDPVCGIALGHRRLAVLDLSPAGNQPMASRSGRYVVAYNGEDRDASSGLYRASFTVEFWTDRGS